MRQLSAPQEPQSEPTEAAEPSDRVEVEETLEGPEEPTARRSWWRRWFSDERSGN